MKKNLIARGQVTVYCQSDAYTINLSIKQYIYPANAIGTITNAVSFTSQVKVVASTVSVTNFTIGAITKPSGFGEIIINNTNKTITFTVAANTNNMADSGIIYIPIIIDGVTYSESFTWSKSKQGETGPSGEDSNILDWVKDWNTNKTVIGSDSVITPKIFAGVKNSNDTITGVAIGKFTLKTVNASGSVVSEIVNGVYGFKDGNRTFSIDAGGNIQIGNKNQIIKYNASTGKIEFGSDVSLNWVSAINTAKSEAINLAATDATNKTNAIKSLVQQANDFAGQKVRYIRDWINGSTANTGNHWVQIMAIDETGTNIALNKNVSGASSDKRVTNGDTNTSSYVSGGAGLKQLTVDLGEVYSIKYIHIWHFYSDKRTYFDTKTECSVDGVSWFTIFDSDTEGTYKETIEGIIHYVSEYDRATFKALKAQETADAITKTANDENWATKLTYIGSTGIFTGTLSANTVNAIKINATQITAGTIDVARLNVAALKASLITTANIEALTLNVVRGKIGGWTIDGDSIFRGTKSNTSGAYTSASGSITIGSNGIRGFKWRLDETGAGALAGGNISWDANGNVTFGANVSLNWTNAANNALTSAKSYADTKKTEAINAAATDATNKVNSLQIGGRNYALDTANLILDTTQNKLINYELSDKFIETLNNLSKKTVVISAYVEGKDLVIDSAHYGIDICVHYDDGTSEYVNLTRTVGLPNSGNIEGKIYHNKKILQNKKIVKTTNTCIFIRNATSIGKFIIKNLKVEISDKPTDWVHAPEDLESDIKKADDAAKAAQTTANTAKGTADAATTRLNNWASDSIISPTEKTALKQQLADIKAEQLEINRQVSTYGLSTASEWTNYASAYNAAVSALNKYTVATPENITVGTDYNNIAAYYEKRQIILQKIATAAKSYADNLVNNIVIGGSNLLNNSGNWRAANWNNGFTSNGGGYTIDNTVLYNAKPTLSTLVGAGLVHDWVKLDNNVEYTYSAMVMCNETITGTGSAPLHYWSGKDNVSQSKLSVLKYDTSVTANVWRKIYITFKLTGDANSFRPFFYRGSNGTTKYWIAYLKLEKGNKPTDWSPSISDVQKTVSDAQTAANNAQSSANTANTKLAEIANDNLLTPSEKQEALKEWNIIKGEYSTVIAQANTYSVATTTYTNAYNALNTYITPLVANLTVNSTIVGTTFRNNFKAYYDAKIALLKLVTDKAKALADAAQNTANNIQVGGKNLIRNSNFAFVLNNWVKNANSVLSVDSSVKLGQSNSLKIASTTANFDGIVSTGYNIEYLPFQEYTVSLWAYRDSTKGAFSADRFFRIYLPESNGSTHLNYHHYINVNNTNLPDKKWVRFTTTFKTGGGTRFGGLQMDFSNNSANPMNIWITNIQVEKGNKITDWTLAQEDISDSIEAAKQTGVNAQTVADAITKKANDEKWATKLTYIDGTGIFTGTLSANTVNAVKINASQITAGTIDAARINVAALKTSLITAGNIEALTLNVTKGKIGGWTIGADNITIGTLNSTSSTPIQIRSTTSGTTGQVYSGQIKPYGITLSWLKNGNAGHFIMGQVTSGGTAVKTGFIGIQMMAWDGTEYFCLSANHVKENVKEVYNRIAGWAFDSVKIWKNNVSLGSDGSIQNGTKWQINNDGSGRLANGNILWDASGTITFGTSVSLNWTNAANNALTSAKSYADTKKTEAINAAATDATNKMNSAKNDGMLYCRGTGNNRSANRMITLNGTSIYNAGGRGLQLIVIKRSDLSVLSCIIYDVYGDTTKRTELATALNALKDDVIVVITSFDAIYIDDAISNAIIRCGGSGTKLIHRNPYALVGIPGIGKGNGIEVSQSNEATVPYAEISTRILNGIPQGINSVQKAILENALGGSSYPKLTKIDSTGIYTGTLTASQITAGTISADRIAAGSITASKLDAASIKSSIINTDYINGLTLNFVRGKIGGWTIGSDTINIGSIGATGAMPIQLRSVSTGSGYVYSGQYKPYGLTMTWLQSANAGHFVFGQVMASGNTVKTGFIGLQMMNWLGVEYFTLSTNYTKSGGIEVYNRIAGWAFDNDSIYRGTKNNTAAAFTAASGSITIGSNGIRGFKWRLDSTGAGAVAGGNISWDAAGTVTFGSSVTLNWTTYADTKKNEAISAAATDATNKVNAVSIGGRNYVRNTSNVWSSPVTLNNILNQCIFSHTVYTDGWIAGETISVSFEYKYEDIVKVGTATTMNLQGGGNVTGYTNGWPSHNFFSKIDFTKGSGIAAVKYSFIVNSNQLANASFGLNIRHDYLTGKVCIRNLKVERGTKTTDWSPAPEDINQRLTQITNTGVYTGTVGATQIKVDSAIVVGGSSYNGSISVRDASNVIKVTLDRNGITAVGGKIGGWVIASNQISKNSVILGSDGSISNGTKWKLGNDGSGYVANGNVSWTAAGAVTITGTVNATSGIIGGFTISGNKLTNKASDSALIFDSLSGASYLSINENTSTLVAMRADSSRTAIGIQTYATGAVGIKIIANAGSTYAVESYGPHQFGQRAGEKWNAPGVLFTAICKGTSILYNRWGDGLKFSSFTKEKTGFFRCYHNLGHTQYVVVANPYWDDGMNGHGNSYIRVEYITSTSFVLRVVNADNGNMVDTWFTFSVMGRNNW